MYDRNMFSKKKKSPTKPLIIIGLILALFGFGFWISQGDLTDGEALIAGTGGTDKTEITKKIDEKSITDALAINNDLPKITDKKEEPPINSDEKAKLLLEKDDSSGISVTNEEKDMIQKASKPYYLVKEVDGLIKLFHYSSQGEEKVIRITGIPYNLLSEVDQQLFKKGVMNYSIEELNDLLQDFES